MKHKYNIGQLVELNNGVRLIVENRYLAGKVRRYALSTGFGGDMCLDEFDEDELSPVHNPTYREPS